MEQGFLGVGRAHGHSYDRSYTTSRSSRLVSKQRYAPQSLGAFAVHAGVPNPHAIPAAGGEVVPIPAVGHTDDHVRGSVE
jgi:hypothetical protein